MRAAIVAAIAFALALAACSTTLPGAGNGADGGLADTMTSDAADGGAERPTLPCNGEGICYSSDCTTIASCTDIGTCPGGQLYPSQCFGPDAGRDGASP